MAEKIISFAGVRHADIPYYMAKIMSTKGGYVLVIDNSYENDLYLAVQREEGSESALKQRNIFYMCNVCYDQSFFEKFASVVVYHGMDIDEEIWKASTDRYLMVNTDRFDMRAARDAVRDLEDQVTIIVVDAYYEKIKEPMVAKLLEITGTKLKDTLVLPAEPADRSALEAFQFNGVQRVAQTSKVMKELMQNLYQDLYGEIKAKLFKKVIAKAN